MRPQIKALKPRSAQSPSKTAGRVSPGRRLPWPAERLRQATQRDRRRGGRSIQSRLRQELNLRSERGEQATPMIPLTLRAMNSIRHSPTRSSVRLSLALSSLLALMALACFPVLAGAEDSSGYQYNPTVPTVTGHPTSPTHSNSSVTSPAHSSTSPNASPSSSGSNPGSASGDPSGSKGNPSTDTPGGVGQDSHGKASTNGQHSSGGGQPSGSSQGQQPAGAKSTSSDSSSSPLVPILLVIAVLAAISIGVVMMRQRRQRQGASSTPSPKAS
jgi:cobalamin biosynthesis Mg chelatase CobN